MTSTLDQEENIQHDRNLVKPYQARQEMIKEVEVRGTINRFELKGPEQEQQLISNINAIITSYSSNSESDEKSSDSEAELQAEEEQVSVLMLRLSTEIDVEKV